MSGTSGTSGMNDNLRSTTHDMLANAAPIAPGDMAANTAPIAPGDMAFAQDINAHAAAASTAREVMAAHDGLKSLLNTPVLAPLWSAQPHLPSLLAAWEDRTLGDIAQEFRKPGPPPSPAVRACMVDMAAKTLGAETAAALQHRLEQTPFVLSANYHSIECYPELAQSLHFFGLHDLLDTQNKVIPVLSCTTVSLQSATYPRGLMLAREAATGPHRMHLPLFPASQQDTMIMAAPALTRAGLSTMRSRWRKLDLSAQERKAVDALVDEHVDRNEIYAQSTFCEQVTRINASLCRARFPDAPDVRVVYLELEAVARSMLERDLLDTNTILGTLLFDPKLRHNLLERLANARGCWTRAVFGSNREPLPRTGRSGTAFFWRKDAKGRRLPLRCITEGKRTLLTGWGFSLPFEPEALVAALHRGEILPGLFSTYSTLVMQHGLLCCGGIFFADYMPAMLAAAVSVLDEAGLPYPEVPAYAPLCAVPLTVQARATGVAKPSGAVEMNFAGGLGHAQLQKLTALPAADVLSASFAEWYGEYVPAQERPSDYAAHLDRLAARWKGVELAPL